MSKLQGALRHDQVGLMALRERHGTAAALAAQRDY